MTSKREAIEQAAAGLTKELIARGKLLEAGFALFAQYVIPKDAPPDQVRDMLLAFMAGAEHLYSSMMSSLDAGAEPTEADMQRMEMIHRELDEWRGKLSEQINPAKGRA